MKRAPLRLAPGGAWTNWCSVSILPADLAVTGAGVSRRPRGWGRKLSARKISHLVTVGQVFCDRAGCRWMVANIYRPDREVLLERAGGRRLVSYTKLGADYRIEVV